MSSKKWLAGGAGVTLCAVLAWGTDVVGGQSAGSVPIETVADYIHGVLQSDRTFYTVQVVRADGAERRDGVVGAMTRGKNTAASGAILPGVVELGGSDGSQVRYRLVGLNPINTLNGPANEFERKALEAVMAHPEQPHKGMVKEGNTRYFQAVYADLAVSPVCVTCHNADPRSSKHDYALHDVLGGVAISIPMLE